MCLCLLRINTIEIELQWYVGAECFALFEGHTHLYPIKLTFYVILVAGEKKSTSLCWEWEIII